MNTFVKTALTFAMSIAFAALPAATMGAQARQDADATPLASAQADKKAELQERFKSRDAKLQEYKRAGKLGETTDGTIEAVKGEGGDSELAEFIREENRDRQSLYEILAKERDVDVKIVAEEAAKRNYDRARKGDWLKTRGGEWKQK